MAGWRRRASVLAGTVVLAATAAALLRQRPTPQKSGGEARPAVSHAAATEDPVETVSRPAVGRRPETLRWPTTGRRPETLRWPTIGRRPDGAATVVPPLDPAIPTPSPLVALLRTEPPSRDPLALMARLGGGVTTASRAPRTAYQRGDQETFWLHDLHRQEYSLLAATLAVVTPQAYFWVESGQPYDGQALEAAARRFSDHVLPTVRGLFGHEWSPGIDGDVRLHILHHHNIPGIAGFFSSSDEMPVTADPHSNEREMFYINLGAVDPGSDRYLALLAHELQHMIHWWQDLDESTWLNEGLSDLAATVAGYPQQDGSAFVGATDTALQEWRPTDENNADHYAAAYLFVRYLHNRYGDGFLRRLVQEPANGARGVEAALAAVHQPASFDDVFLDWVVANAIDDATWQGARFGYHGTAGEILTRPWAGSGIADRVEPYGTDYYDVSAAVHNGGLHLVFQGDTSVGLLEPEPVDRVVWWSGRGDNGDSRLTCAIDLTAVHDAEVHLALWYELERDWDYAYLRLSTDNGQTWLPLSIPGTTDANPNGANFGAGLTGASEGWRDVRLDLTPHCGRPVQLRFEVVTDDAVSLTGMAITDLVARTRPDTTPGGPPASEYHDLRPRCRAEGWQRLRSRLPQRWSLQLIATANAERALHRIPVGSDGTAAIDVAKLPADARVLLAVSSLTPGTRNGAGYRLAPKNS